MTVSTAIIKKTAKVALKGNWCNAIIVCAAMIIFYYLCSLASDCMATVFGTAVGYPFLYAMLLFLFAPFLLGVIRYFWRLLFDVKDNPVSIFYYFSERKLYARALRAAIAIAVRAAVFSFFVFMPAWIVKLLSGTAFYDFFHLPIPLWSSNLSYFVLFFETVARVLLFFFLLRYYALPFLAVADEEMEIGEAIHFTNVLSKASAWEPFLLILSFIGWLLLSLLAVPAIFILPYFFTALSVQFRFMIAAYNRNADQSEVPSYPAYDAM